MKTSGHEELFDANRKLWNERTQEHYNSAFYDVESFVSGKNSLNRIELDLVGDVSGKTLLHLQCHFGQDTLSFCRMGAQTTGIDFSENAIKTAQQLSERIRLASRFICCNVYETRKYVAELFDIVFTSYGTIGWLPELKPWAEVISASLNPGGIFVMADFHPYIWMMDENYEEIVYSYFNHGVIETSATGTYTGNRELHKPMKEFGWNHPISDILNSLHEAGLQLEVFREHDGSPYNCFPGMIQCNDGMYRFEKWDSKLPLVYSLRFRKPV